MGLGNLRIWGFDDWEIGKLMIRGFGDQGLRVKDLKGADLTRQALEEMFSVISVGNCKLNNLDNIMNLWKIK